MECVFAACSNIEFSCGGFCIPYNKTCDNIYDCSGKEDEAPSCPRKSIYSTVMIDSFLLQGPVTWRNHSPDVEKGVAAVIPWKDVKISSCGNYNWGNEDGESETTWGILQGISLYLSKSIT